MPRSRPVEINGITYPSLRAASRAGAPPLSSLRRALGLIGPEKERQLPPPKGVKARVEYLEMPRTSAGHQRSFTIPALRNVQRLLESDATIASVRFLFRHYYLIAAEKLPKGKRGGTSHLKAKQRWQVRNYDTGTMPRDLFLFGPTLADAAEATERGEVTRPFSPPERNLHEPAHGKELPDQGGLWRIVITRVEHTSL